LTTRRSPPVFGAHLERDGVRFRLWAPDCSAVTLSVEGPEIAGDFPLERDGEGWCERFVGGVGTGARYCYQIDGNLRVPDPASRFQPDDLHRASEIVDPADFVWQCRDWRGRRWEEAVIYELHVGTLSPEGTFRLVEKRLGALVELGVTAIELMPVADFPGRHDWGCNGALPFAPDSSYGRPEDLKALIDAAHRRGLMVLLDVVYNHFGPEGNYLHVYAKRFYDAERHTPWGAAINFDGPASRWVREFFIENAVYWLSEYRFDGLRLDHVDGLFEPKQYLHRLQNRFREPRGFRNGAGEPRRSSTSSSRRSWRCTNRSPRSGRSRARLGTNFSIASTACSSIPAAKRDRPSATRRSSAKCRRSTRQPISAGSWRWSKSWPVNCGFSPTKSTI
jgi:1,4-alpha-glucan branching enzyme/maltooligosyltrehalose trehalohydrolase